MGLRLLLVDDHEVILDGVASMLRRAGSDVDVVATAFDVAGAMSALDDHEVDIVLSDVRLGRESGLDLCRSVVARHPDLPVVMFTVYDDEEYLYQALRAGARGFVAKQATGQVLVEHLVRAHRGETVIDAGLAGRVAARAARVSRGQTWPGAHLGLSQRESEVLSLLAQGCTNRAVARRLVVGEETVKTHVSAVLRKLGARDRAHAVAIGVREGVVR